MKGDMKVSKISQSMIKDFEKYNNGLLCGNVFRGKYITKQFPRNHNDSKTKALGRYFEYLLTGEKPTGYDEFPKPEYLAKAWTKFNSAKSKGEKYIFSTSDMLKEYREVHRKSDLVKQLLKKSGVTIIRAQVYLTKGNLEGTIDIEASYKPNRKTKSKNITIDVKYSGMVTDKWTEFGWAWSGLQKKNHGTQAAQYQYLSGNPVYFLVVNSTEVDEVRFFKAVIDDFNIDQHVLKAEQTLNAVKLMEDIGWENYPSLKECSDCPLKENCKDSVSTLVVEEIPIDLIEDE